MSEAKNAQEAAKALETSAALNQSAAAQTSTEAQASAADSAPAESSSVEPVLVRFEKPWSLYNKGEKATVAPDQAARLIEKKIAVKA